MYVIYNNCYNNVIEIIKTHTIKMIDIFMLIMMNILAVVLLVISLYLLVYYCHPDDAGFGSGLVCKIFAILGLSVCWAQVLLLPLDVSNTRGSGGGMRMDIICK